MRYANGEVRLVATDLGSHGGGIPWSHTRSFTNRFTGDPADSQNRNGLNWFLTDMPQLAQDGSGVGVIRIVQDTLWFDEDDGDYIARFFFREKLSVANAGTIDEEFTLLLPSGHRLKFFGFDGGIDADLQGQFKSAIDPFGHEHSATYDENNRLVAFTMELATPSSSSSSSFAASLSTDPGNVGVYAGSISYAYEYTAGIEADRLQSVTLSINGVPTRRAEYEYYGSSDDNGTADDLKLVIRQVWDGAQWVELDRSHYRYYTTDPAPGVHAIKYVVGPEAYARMKGRGLTPEKATNDQIADYADHYFEYDSSGRVAREETRGGASAHTFTYSASAFGDGYNSWKWKTTETLPDGKKWVVYTNFAGGVMLKILETSGGTDLSYEAYIYDDNNGDPGPTRGAVLQRVMTSAIDAVNDANASLFTLKSSTGVIWAYTYYSSDPKGGLLEQKQFQLGDSGSPVALETWDWEASPAVGTDTLLVPASVTMHPGAVDPGDPTITISREWLLNSNSESTFQVEQITVEWPVIETTENGAGGVAGNQHFYVFDEFGQPVWEKDERGAIFHNVYHLATGALLRHIDDVDTAQVEGAPSGWSTVNDPGVFGLNLVTDYRIDSEGRTIAVLGPAHTVDLCGTATTVRRAHWTAYMDVDFERRSASGYVSGESAKVLGPIDMVRFDRKGRVTDSIKVSATCGSDPCSLAGELPQCQWERWMSSAWDDHDRFIHNRTYSAIPKSGQGMPGVNYLQTTFEYDSGFRPTRTIAPDGTITRTVYDTHGRPSQVWIGTNDTGATSADPDGAGCPNNMTLIESAVYDSGATLGDGLLTSIVRPVDATSGNDRETAYHYDERDRLDWVIGEGGFCRRFTYDNLDRVTAVEQKADDQNGAVLTKRVLFYDGLSRLFLCSRYGSGGTGNSLKDEFWYDPAGNLMKLLRQGRRTFEKFAYDGPGRTTRQYFCYNITEYGTPTDYGAAASVNDNTVVHQNEWTYDAASNTIQQITRERFHTASGTGELGDATTQPYARVSYQASYLDGLGRQIAQADYGTNAAVAWTRSELVPLGSDTILLSRVEYNGMGELANQIDPRGIVTRHDYDQAGRLRRVVENYQPGCAGPDANRTTEFDYDASGRLAAMIALNSATGNQVTAFTFGVSNATADSNVARNDLVKTMAYPDSTSASDRVEFRYNRQGEVKYKKDPAGTVHEFNYDKLGRWIDDRITAFGPGIDETIKRISRTFENRGRIAKVTSYNAATSGSVVNELERTYNAFRQIQYEYQNPAGAVSGGTPKVEYGYADGTNNTVRRTTLKYPSGRTITYDYGTGGQMDDVLCRVKDIKESTQSEAAYTYFGWEHRIAASYSPASLSLTLWQNAAIGDAGDQYVGLDRFGRTQQMAWTGAVSGSSTTYMPTFQYGFDPSGNRTWRKEPTAPESAKQDEAYEYDRLSQLTNLKRGVLNVNRTSINGVPAFEEDFSFDSTGNWHAEGDTLGGAYVQSANGTVQVNQNRIHNQANELTEITNVPGTTLWNSVYESDAAGNMTKVDMPTTMNSSWTCSYDAWNRLVKVEIFPQAETVATYTYDGLFRRVQRYTLQPSPVTRHLYYSDQWQLLEDRQGGALKKLWLWGIRYPDDLIYRERFNSPTDKHYAIHDYFNVTGVCHYHSASSTTIINERFGYDAYGTSRVMTWSFGNTTDSLDWEFRFHGAHFDDETGLYLMRHRYLHPKLGRWIVTDPLGFNADSRSLYRFVSNGPISATDPTGLAPCVGRYKRVTQTTTYLATCTCPCSITTQDGIVSGWSGVDWIFLPGNTSNVPDGCFCYYLCTVTDPNSGTPDLRLDIGPIGQLWTGSRRSRPADFAPKGDLSRYPYYI